jgi:hypothetical protein
MADQANSQARPVFRWLAGLTCPVFFVMALWATFPGVFHLDEPPSIWLMFVFLWSGFYFAFIAATGRGTGPTSQRGLQRELEAAAHKYASGQMSLEEYGSVTKEILERHPRSL